MNNQQNKFLTTQNTVLWLLLLINLILVLCAFYLLFRDEKTDSDTVDQSRQRAADDVKLANSTLKATRPQPVHKQPTGSDFQSNTELATRNDQSSLAAGNLKSIPEHKTSGLDHSASSQASAVLKPDQNLIVQQNTTPTTQSNSSQTTVTKTETHPNPSTIVTVQATQTDKTVTQQITQVNNISAPDIGQTGKSDHLSMTVTKGDNLWDIAKDVYGTGFDYPLIFKANPDLNNPDIIEIGTVLQIPLKSDHPPH
ncbi:MAG: LysM peptidoglycan-binding domain-containing protein [Gammaproteobacteria bacterium]|nr:LysM peptidoglycan-binding domain-containing protein [Gammaproteobacteria bacterium]